MIHIKDGGQTERLGKKLLSIGVGYSGSKRFELWLNGDSLSYLTLDEMIDLRDEINDEIQKCFKGITH